MDEIEPALVEPTGRGRLRYWARLIKLLREPWPARTSVPARMPQASRSPEPTRQPAQSRLDDQA